MATTPPLHVGDTVRFAPISDRRRRCEGTLVVQPWGRRKHAIVRDVEGRVHFLPSRDHIIDLVDRREET